MRQQLCDSEPVTGRFDNVGAFVSPNQLLLHTQVTYDVNKRVTLVGNFANIVNRCWGGTKVPFAINHACNYVATYVPARDPRAGNQYNPGNHIQPFLATPYDPTFPNFPFKCSSRLASSLRLRPRSNGKDGLRSAGAVFSWRHTAGARQTFLRSGQ